MSLKHLPDSLKPREKILSHGAHILTDAELLAVILRTGVKGVDVLSLADNILTQCGGLGNLLHSSAAELKQIHGLGGKAKRAELLAIIELGKRSLAHNLAAEPILSSSAAVKDFCRTQLTHYQHEVFAVLFLDNQHRLLKFEKLFYGSINQTSVYPREILRKALLCNAAALIITHNHPGADASPSPQDINFTNNIKTKLSEVDIRLIDHIIVAPGCCSSMAELQLI